MDPLVIFFDASVVSGPNFCSARVVCVPYPWGDLPFVVTVPLPENQCLAP